MCRNSSWPSWPITFTTLWALANQVDVHFTLLGLECHAVDHILFLFTDMSACVALLHADAACDEGAGRRIGEIPERGDPGQQHLQMISAHVSAYITHVRTQLKQTIPKAIVHCLVSCFTTA